MVKKLLLIVVLLGQVLNVHSQDFDWATSVSGSDYEYGIKAVGDSQGNTYIIGFSTGYSFEYNGTSYQTNGEGDAFFGKLDSNNQLIWMKSVGGNDPTYHDEAKDIHIDAFGDIYLAFEGNGSGFNYDGQVLSGINSPGQYSGEGVLIKVDSNGNYIWHDSGTVSSSFSDITTDSSGNIYLVGSFYTSITLGGSISLSNPSSGTTRDMLVAKYQPNGTILWAKRAGGLPHNTFVYGSDIVINQQTNEVIVLSKSDGDVFYSGVPSPVNNSSDEGLVLASYDMNGNINWLKHILSQFGDWNPYGSGLDISDTGVIGVSGSIYGNGIVGFYNSDGSIISEYEHTSSDDLVFYSIAFNEYNEAFLSGWTDGNAILGTSPGSVPIQNDTGFVVKMDIFQDVKWVSEITSSSFTNSVTYENSRILYSGRIDDDFTYNNGQNTITHTYGDALFGELIDSQIPDNESSLSGTVYQDINENCSLDTSDIRQESIIVKATETNGNTFYTNTNSYGLYNIPVDIGTYTIEILTNPFLENLISQNCYTNQQATINQAGQDINDLDFPIEIADCPLLSIDISSDRRRRCFASNTYVNYANNGVAEAQNVEVVVKLPEYVDLISASNTYTVDAQGNYVFNIGTLDPNESGNIHIIDFTQCINGITGLTQCTEAWITPPNTCADTFDPGYPNWDNSYIRVVDSNCINNSTAQFSIVNYSQPGIGDMQNPREYRIYVDNVLTVTSTYQLNGGESISIQHPANGQTIRLEADQDPNYPGDSQPQQTVEACGTDNNGNISTGYVNTMSMDDQEPEIEIQCLEIIDSYDPNDKLVSPTGITVNNYLEAGTTLDYMIRFQNKGTATAYTVIIEDELSPHLDPSTIQWGLGSHPYTVNVSGTQTPVIQFIFDDINLPHSDANELGSNWLCKI